MAGAIGNIDAYSDALVVLGTAGIVIPLVRRIGLSPILAKQILPAQQYRSDFAGRGFAAIFASHAQLDAVQRQTD